MQVGVHEYSKSGRKMHVYTAKQYCLSCQTQVFDAWNNIVWRVKQYCLSSRCQMFGEWKSCFREIELYFMFIHLWFICRSLWLESVIMLGLFHIPFLFGGEMWWMLFTRSCFPDKCDNVCFANRLRMQFFGSDSSLDARKGFLRPFVWQIDILAKGGPEVWEGMGRSGKIWYRQWNLHRKKFHEVFMVC